MIHKTLAILGSSRSNGNTYRALQKLIGKRDIEIITLQNLNITPFDYQYNNKNDDFIGLINKIIQYDNIILASPIYWYAISAQMKIFIDRLSDLTTHRRDIKQKLVDSSTNIILFCTYVRNKDHFEGPIESTCKYLKLNYLGCIYHSMDPSITNEPLETALNKYLKDNQ